MSGEECRVVPQGEGYADGYRQGVRDMAERIKKYYRCLGSMTNPCIMEYYINQVLKEMLEGG